ncbi:hypothetical protein EUGRSUZ_I01379 [Eucalyptus grandis]|uniref:Uncharacterized protein n=2 Tax=Eucalyptus grandis TaxID=71139 RepID=A0ACC3JEZ6_EUCGR|nr:hypothetical protein EUGRSUZ_I01379 [Eucalyptus grandis]
MAAIVSPWGAKPGAWALDSEEHEDELLQQQKSDAASGGPAVAAAAAAAAPLADFPSLSAAATKPKKKKGQAIPLAEFHTKRAVPKYEPSKGLTREDLLMLPTGPRERSAEELDRSRLGGGFKSYGTGRYGSNNSGEDSSNSRWGSSRVSDDSGRQGGFGRDESRESLTSRADEVDDWSSMKKSTAGNGFEKRERGAFFSSQSKADESDSWVSNKSSEPRRFGGEVGRERRAFSRGGFEGSNGGGADADRWGRRKEDEGSFGSGTDADKWSKRTEDEGGFGSGTDADKWSKRKEDEGGFGSGADADKWGKRKEDEGSFGSSRPRLNLQPRTVAVSDGAGSGSGAVSKPESIKPLWRGKAERGGVEGKGAGLEGD